jgi:hypothetical protein
MYVILQVRYAVAHKLCRPTSAFPNVPPFPNVPKLGSGENPIVAIPG